MSITHHSVGLNLVRTKKDSNNKPVDWTLSDLAAAKASGNDPDEPFLTADEEVFEPLCLGSSQSEFISFASFRGEVFIDDINNLRYDRDKGIYITKDTRKPFTGYMIVKLDEAHHHHFAIDVKDGKLHGFVKFFSKNKRLENQFYYTERKK